MSEERKGSLTRVAFRGSSMCGESGEPGEYSAAQDQLQHSVLRSETFKRTQAEAAQSVYHERALEKLRSHTVATGAQLPRAAALQGDDCGSRTARPSRVWRMLDEPDDPALGY